MSVNVTDVSTFTDPIVAPAGGDLLAAAAAGGLASLQGLSNRTRYLLDTLGYQVAKAQPASPSPTLVYSAVPNTLTDVSLATVTLTPKTNDFLIALAQCQFTSTGSHGVQARITAQSTSRPLSSYGTSNVISTMGATDTILLHPTGLEVALYNEATTFKLQVTTTDGLTCGLNQNWFLMILRIKGL